MTLAFRELHDVNLENLVSLWKICELTRPWNDPYTDIQFARAGAASAILVGFLEERLVASVMVGHDGHRGALYYLAVDPKFQKRGFGKATVAAAEAWLRERGVWKINLMVRSDNEKAGRFYERLGYEVNPVQSFGKRIDVT
ncbi:MAG: GNAT family acetyltransferase [Aestuariivirga sp.]|nr:GNAT family acetyltransferase [Aestuariivirga sp.]